MDLRMDFKILFVNPMTVVINLLLLSPITDAICILPPELRNTAWIYNYTKPDDNQPVTTTLTIRTTVLADSSINLDARGTTIDDWTCISSLTLSDTESVAVFKSDTTYSEGPFTGSRRLYLCMKFTKVTDNLFYFYLLSDVDNTLTPNERAFNPPANSQPSDSDPLCSTFCQYTSEPKIRTLQRTGTTDVVPGDAALCTPCESPCEERVVACPDLRLTSVNFTTITNNSGINYQDNITYACITGYELKSGNLTRECLANESWSGSPPVCEIVSCPDLALVNFATITAETGKNYQDNITYACNKGYELKSGDLTRQCQDDKAWSGSPPVCEIVSCPDLAPVNFATITAETGKNYQDTITYACNRGYELKSGDLTRQCQDDKAWSGNPPVCEIVSCPDLALVNFATITAETGKNYQGTITYACNRGYELKSGNLIRQCQDDKAWSGSPPVCEVVSCPDLALVNFATITAETGKNYQGTITYACNRGYELKSGDLTRQCQDDKAWSGNPPVCEAVVCPDLRIEPINFATITATTGTSYQDKVTYACITNYVLKSGDLTRQCFADKTWSGSPPVCEVVSCPDLAPVNSATITAETGKNYQDNITYACNKGYELKSGDLTRQCQDDKAWSGSPPVCEIVSCPDLAPVNFATITAETGKNYQGTITYACNKGYELKSGNLIRQCQDDKAWSGSPPVCEVVSCPDLALVNFATITAETGKNYQSTITYACNRGYELKSGNLIRQCQDDKAWSGRPPVCEVVSCPDLALVNFATITDETGKNYQDTITYDCNRGYELKSGDLTRQCQDDKAWSGRPPVCEIVSCPDLALVNFATITAETGKNYQGKITYACNRGYELKSGDLTRQCQDDKAWSGRPPVCVRIIKPTRCQGHRRRRRR
ncbi:CUB and sushi domain-containing protein 3-like isoform X3 [Mytilus trossulus]|uniref:CUB and sushi domain-containing protein 3-like isoform X3 n=1 Tax=Mytilus trossulus TaxID=6551 RepID=UPI00300548CA